MEKICVFCGSSPGVQPEYSQAAEKLGHILAKKGIGLVYGGGSVGLMGRIARAALEKGGSVTGVVPRSLVEREVVLTGLDDLRIVGSMHERKALMAELSDAFIALPGGLGTIEEFVEILTWAQLGMHRKPCGLLNVRQYWDPFVQFLGHVAGEQFIEEEHLDMVMIEDDPDVLIERFRYYTPPENDKAVWALRMNNG